MGDIAAWLRQQIESEERRVRAGSEEPEDIAFHEGMRDAYTLTLREVER